LIIVPRRVFDSLHTVSTRQNGNVGFSFVPRDLDITSGNLMSLLRGLKIWRLFER
jgi:hypothetical protein